MNSQRVISLLVNINIQIGHRNIAPNDVSRVYLCYMAVKSCYVVGTHSEQFVEC